MFFYSVLGFLVFSSFIPLYAEGVPEGSQAETAVAAQDDGWGSVVATVYAEEEPENSGLHPYTVEYRAPESTAINAEGHRIGREEPITQYGMMERRPQNGQQVEIRYRRDEPVIFEFVGPIQYDDE